MKLFLLSQDVNCNYDTYDSCVVCAENESQAISIHPDGQTKEWVRNGSWVTKDLIKCEEIGIANPKQKKGVICASFNAG